MPKASKTDLLKFLVRTKNVLKECQAEAEPCPDLVRSLEAKINSTQIQIDQATPPDKKRGFIEGKLKANKTAVDKVTANLVKDRKARDELITAITASEVEATSLATEGDRLREQLAALRKDEASYIAAQGKPLLDPAFVAFAETLPDDGDAGDVKAAMAIIAKFGALRATDVANHSAKAHQSAPSNKDKEGDHEMSFEDLALDNTELDDDDLEEDEELPSCDKETVNKTEWTEFKKQMAAVVARNKARGLKRITALKAAKKYTDQIRKAAQLNDGAWTVSLGKRVKK